jgi:outer membrane protein assembly factor BamA
VGGGNNSSNGEWGWVGNLSFNYNGEKLNSAVSFNHDVSLGAGRTGSTERTGGTVTLGNRFTQELSGAIDFGYFLNKSNRDQFSVQPIDEKTLDLNCKLHYDINNDLALEANYHYVNIDYGQFGSRASQNIFMLRLVMRHELFL